MKPLKILSFTVSIIILLSLLCIFFPENGINFAGKRLLFPSLEDVLIQEEGNSPKAEIFDPDAQPVIEDSVKNVFADSLRLFHDFFEDSPARIHLPNNDLTFFNTLFEVLYNINQQTNIHILHYGDSQIEGDRITGCLRRMFQERFGGNGPGLLPIVQPIPSITVSQDYSGNLTRYIISGNLAAKAPHNRYGPLGQATQLSGSGKITIAPRKNKDAGENIQTFHKVRLFVSNNSAGFKAKLQTSPKEEPITQVITEAGTAMKTLTWNLPVPARKVIMQFSGKAELSAVALDGEAGVNIDNIPLRGSSGVFFTEIDTTSIIPAIKELNVRLIMLEFGGNTVPGIRNEKGVEQYCKSLARQIARWKQISPEIPVMLIGPSDMSIRVKGKLQTYPMLPLLVESMQRTATENGAAFWNMYDAMGGENSMLRWVKERPALASADYIHFTTHGADFIADLLFRSLMSYYDYFALTKITPKE
ncbi:MAG: hypothetical protein LBS54_05740 [Dysgonamonadaceae bacterium]|jgi:lysophospholipase L1-like esterase|nr:hypothetical protein [Dysgonamonadaceae bacterium]